MKYYLSGIAGSGMNVLAQYLLSTGHEVYGSDRSFDSKISLDYKRFLKEKGAHIVPQNGNILNTTFDKCIFSAAIEQDMPDYQKAAQLGISIISRSLFLKNIFNEKQGIGIAGISGKTTVTGMLATLLIESGQKPDVFCGAEILHYTSHGMGGNFFSGNSSLLVAEVDESDQLIHRYKPKLAIITNISEDHMSVEKAEPLFLQFMNNADRVIYNLDCPFLSKLAKKTESPVISFSLKDEQADIFLSDIRSSINSSSFYIKDILFTIPLPAKYNVENAAAAVTAASALDIPLQSAADYLQKFTGIKGRFEIIQSGQKPLIIYDFAHNPAKMDSLLQTAVSLFSSIMIFFQPHGFSPFKKHLPAFTKIFQKRLRPADTLIIGKIYDAGGTADRTVSGLELIDTLQAPAFQTFYSEDREDVSSLIKQRANKTNACFIVGARDRTLREFAIEISNQIKQS